MHVEKVVADTRIVSCKLFLYIYIPYPHFIPCDNVPNQSIATLTRLIIDIRGM